MKNHYLIVFLILFFTNCNKKENLTPLNVNEYDKFSTELLSNLNYVANDLRANKANFESQDIVFESVGNLYKNNNDKFKLFTKYYSQTSEQKSSKKLLSLTAESEIESEITKSETPQQFLTYLNSKINQIHLSNIELNEKDYLLKTLIIYKVTTEFLCDNNDLVKPTLVQSNLGTKVILGKPRSMGWWEKWGKCAAGTVGGAGLGGLTGAGVGSALPVVGTLVGGIAGGIFGGLAGAGASC